MAWGNADSTVEKVITVNPSEGVCTLNAASIVYPTTMIPGQTSTFGIGFTNTGSGQDRFRVMFFLLDGTTTLASAEWLSGTGVPAGSGATVTASLTLPASYAKSSVTIHIEGQHDSGFFI